MVLSIKINKKSGNKDKAIPSKYNIYRKLKEEDDDEFILIHTYDLSKEKSFTDLECYKNNNCTNDNINFGTETFENYKPSNLFESFSSTDPNNYDCMDEWYYWIDGETKENIADAMKKLLMLIQNIHINGVILKVIVQLVLNPKNLIKIKIIGEIVKIKNLVRY